MPMWHIKLWQRIGTVELCQFSFLVENQTRLPVGKIKQYKSKNIKLSATHLYTNIIQHATPVPFLCSIQNLSFVVIQYHTLQLVFLFVFNLIFTNHLHIQGSFQFDDCDVTTMPTWAVSIKTSQKLNFSPFSKFTFCQQIGLQAHRNKNASILYELHS